MNGFVYIKSEPGLWTVGHYKPDGRWTAESDHGSEAAAAGRTHYLNGGCAGCPGPNPAPAARAHPQDTLGGTEERPVPPRPAASMGDARRAVERAEMEFPRYSVIAWHRLPNLSTVVVSMQRRDAPDSTLTIAYETP